MSKNATQTWINRQVSRGFKKLRATRIKLPQKPSAKLRSGFLVCDGRGGKHALKGNIYLKQGLTHHFKSYHGISFVVFMGNSRFQIWNSRRLELDYLSPKPQFVQVVGPRLHHHAPRR
jgi:hypothetical protein